MKVRSLLPLVFVAGALSLPAQEKPAADAPAANPASELGAPPPARLPVPVPAPAPAAPTTTPAPEPATAPAPMPSKTDPLLDLTPAQPGQLLPAPSDKPMPESNALLPDIEPDHTAPVPRLKRTKAAEPGATKTEIAEKEMMDLIHLRQAKTKALAGDPTFVTEYHEANNRHTDLEKRNALKKYYTRLFARIRKIDPSTKKLADERETIMTHRLTQFRLTPTEALEEEQHKSVEYLGEAFFGSQF